LPAVKASKRNTARKYNLAKEGKMPGGRTLKYLRVNLSNGKVNVESVDPRIAQDFIGGRGFGISYLYRELPVNVDPLSEENKMIFVNGVLTGTNVQSVARWLVYTRSPLTGALSRSSAGGDFGAWLKFAGYDFIILEGKAEKPVYLHLTRDGYQIHDAGEIWGRNTEETQEWLSQKHGPTTRTACIGPAAEKLVKFAAIVTGRRTCGRTGTGTVMASKNLKAIAINAERKMQLHDEETFKKLVREQIAAYKTNKIYQHHYEWGTTDNQDNTNGQGMYPSRNFRYGRMLGHEKVAAEEYKKLRTGRFGCYSCMAACGMANTVKHGQYAGVNSEGPEYESIWAFSGPIEANSVEATIAADQLCDDYGMDTITTGSTIGFAYELYEKGILTKDDTDGLELTYGNHEAMVELVKQIANREGIGNLLAEGSKRAAAVIGKGAEYYSMSVKGLEMPAYEPRGAKSMGYNFCTSNIGGSHNYGYADQEIFGAPLPRIVDRFAETENADVVIYNQNYSAFREVGIGCEFSRGWGWFPETFGKMLATATGEKQFADIKYLEKVGDRIITMERAFNVRNGFSRKDDTLPKRMLTEPLQTRGAPGEGQMIREQEQFLDRYYDMRGWSRDGIPTPEKIKGLGLDYLAGDLT